MQPQSQSATSRRELRRAVRSLLGASGGRAPEALPVLRAAQAMQLLVRLATDGRYALQIHDMRDGGIVSANEAMRVARGGAK